MQHDSETPTVNRAAMELIASAIEGMPDPCALDHVREAFDQLTVAALPEPAPRKLPSCLWVEICRDDKHPEWWSWRVMKTMIPRLQMSEVAVNSGSRWADRYHAVEHARTFLAALGFDPEEVT